MSANRPRTSDALLAHLKTLHPLLIDLSLDRIIGLLAKLGNPQLKLPPVIHIAGTNGKGSTTAFLQAMLEAAGKRVHTYTSPHLIRFHERIGIAGADGRSGPISEAYLVDLLSRVEAANAGARMTFFEMTTAAAFLGFAETPADAVILEVGLGGRADATNVIAKPRLTIITPVSMDHADKLGDTVAKIAIEKAGILKRGVPCVVSQQSPEGLDAIRAVAGRVGAPLTIWGEDFDAFEQRGRLVFQTGDTLLDLPRPSLLGRHQIVNAGTAIAAALQLPELDLDTRAIEHGLTAVVWPARMQRLSGGRLTAGISGDAEVWLDGGHNPAGGAGPGPDHGRSRGAGAEAAASDRRHDGPEGRGRLPDAVPGPGGADSDAFRSPAHMRRRSRPTRLPGSAASWDSRRKPRPTSAARCIAPTGPRRAQSAS